MGVGIPRRSHAVALVPLGQGGDGELAPGDVDAFVRREQAALDAEQVHSSLCQAAERSPALEHGNIAAR